MKKVISGLAVAVLLVSISNSFAESSVRTEGAAPGEWTMDFDAAKVIAAEKHIPLLLDFSGSDWCGWCNLMEKNVFQKEKWNTYAAKNIMMVLIDFPNDKNLVPEKYVERNNDLKDKYGVRGFPTFIILDDNGETVMGQLTAGQEKTPASFIGELHKLFIYKDREVSEYTKTLKKDDAAQYKQIVEKIHNSEKEIAKKKELIAAAAKAIKSQEQTLAEQKNNAAEFRVSMLGEEQLKKYKNLKATLEKTEKELAEWLKSGPEQTRKNEIIFNKFNTTISETEAELDRF
jgi:thioredoxin-related protein